MILFDFIRNYFKEKVSSHQDISLSDIPSVYNRLAIEGKNGAFAVFLPKRPRENETDVLNIQFSIEEGKIGLDWVLLSPINIANESVFRAAAKSLSYEVRTISNNDVNYLRVEGDKASIICQQLLANLYNMQNDELVELMVEGFNWSAQVY